MFLLAFPILLLSSLACGLWLLRRLWLSVDAPLEEGWIAATLGLLLLGSGVTLLAFTHLLTTGWLWGLTCALLALGWRELRVFLSRERWSASTIDWKRLPTTWWLAAALGVAILLLHGFLALAPNIQWDTMAHHFLAPWLYLIKEGLFDLRQVQQSYFPSLFQMLYALGMGIGGEQTASLLGWWWSALVVIGVLAMGQRVWRLEAGIAAALIMLTQELYAKQLQGGWADSGVALMVLLATWGALQWRLTGHRAWLLAGALGMGGALAGSKHNALLPMVLILLGFLYWAIVDRWSKRDVDDALPRLSLWVAMREAALFGLLALVPPLCWYIRSYLLTGSPTYPLTMFGLFPGPVMPVYVESSWVDRSYTRGLLTLLTYPFTLTYSPALAEGFQGRFPPQWPFLVPYLWWREARHPVVQYYSLLLIGTLTLMFVVAPKETRYMLFAVPWIALLTGGGLLHLLDRLPRYTWRSLGLILLLLLPFGLRLKGVPSTIADRWKVVLKVESRGKYIARAAPVTTMITWMNEHLPEDALVYCLEDRTYRFERDITNYYACPELCPRPTIDLYTYFFREGATHMYLGDGTIIQGQIVRNIVDLPTDPDGVIRFTLPEVMINLQGELIPPERHWVAWVSVRRFLQRAGFEIQMRADGQEEFNIPRKLLLQSSVQQAHYLVIIGFTELYQRGLMELLYSDGLNMIFKYNYAPVGLYADPADFGINRPSWTHLF